MKNDNLENFCRTILFGETLEDKLASPQRIELSKFEKMGAVPDSPGRPDELAFNNSKPMKLPSLHLLEEVRNRGILMHFFLNHELLALEIMALTLLKFPQLPDSFKRGMIKTMKEEQEHASLYIDRMKELDVKMGDVYVNSFFWDCLKDISHPLEFVRAMSLTFEQANLDFSLFYKNAFETVGDTKTAQIMEKVYKDEIGHVGFGLKWFRKWKDSQLSDWEAYVSGLELPLSPSRAKSSQIYDVEGRKKAGLKSDFIERLDVTSFSRGRAPDIYIFNAFTESFIVQPNGFNRPEWGRALEEDLSLLPMVFANQDDLLYTFKENSVTHLKKLKDCGIELPQIEAVEVGEEVRALKGRKAGDLKPWGWSPEMNRVLHNHLKDSKSTMKWDDRFQALFSKKWSIEFNNEINISSLSFQEPENAASHYCSSMEEIVSRFEYLVSQGWEITCIKTPFGASGRNIMRFPNGELTEKQSGRVRNLLKKQGGVIVEPWLQRLADFSLHFEMNEGLRFIGVSRLLNDEHGQYSGSLFGKFESGLPREVLECIHQDPSKGLVNYCKKLAPYLEDKLIRFKYKGPVGIDSFVYKTPTGQVFFRPVVEINFRYTMGRVALEMGKKLASGKCGLLKIFSILSEREREEAGNLVKLKNKRLEVNENGKWIAGKCLLNEWHENIKFPIAISIGNSLEECSSGLS